MRTFKKALNEMNSKGEFAGWIAFYNRKKLEIRKNEANGIAQAKELALKHFKVPKSKKGLLAIAPAYEDELNETSMASIGTGTIPTGPESVVPDFKFRGMDGFDCDSDTFCKCMNGKKKYKQWKTFLNRDDELVTKAKAYMSQSKVDNFLLRNKTTGEMVAARNR